ncbi:DUF2975 domain-containing protein [Mangrovimonas sp. YM274]|uniref:DUF2975 domain-containing protein n=1 Tax=Mangrovimonas sp. YM274 TaxID=3070660 RepID=UPI0027DAF1EF|nr:DUF2975 domain-containing protein [Mangrovimonas sp. YM274]WMI69236.1 DUF2975 domain-containing protein [Mangrovimonas sp. YM274]
MRKLNILKTLIWYLWFFGALTLVLLIIAYINFLYTGNADFFIKVHGDPIGTYGSTYVEYILAFLAIVSFAMFVRAVYLFDKVLYYFKLLKPFDGYVIKNFSIIGKLFVMSGMVSVVPLLLFSAIVKRRIEFVSSTTASSFIPIICIGLFFMVLSELFKIAKAAKEENELTV